MVVFWFSLLQNNFLLTQIFSTQVPMLEAKKHSEIHIYGQNVWTDTLDKSVLFTKILVSYNNRMTCTFRN